MEESLRRGLLVPSIVVTEFIRLAGKRVGEEAALVFLKGLTIRGANIVAVDEKIAVEAGKLALRHWDVPIADILIGATTILYHAENIISDDQHFKQMELKTKWL